MPGLDTDLSPFQSLADIVRNNLENQQDWTQVRVHNVDGRIDGDGRDTAGPGTARPRATDSSVLNTEKSAAASGCTPRPRILLSGLPPRRMYIHPDEQVDILRAERALGHGQRIPQPPEFEWVLPVHLAETPSVGLFASVFDSIGALPPGALEGADRESDDGSEGSDDDTTKWKQWRGEKRAKRLLLAVVQDDSTVVYYFMHDGIVKPRQN